MRPKPLAYALAIVFGLIGCGPKDSKAADATTTTGSTAGKEGATVKPPVTALKVDIVKEGKGAPAANGDTIWVLYSGKLGNGMEFDSTSKRNDTPFAVQLGGGAVIKGWEQGLIGMKEGGERNLSIPYMLAYKEQGQGDTIPPKSDLFFNIKAVALVKANEANLVDVTEKKVGQGQAAKKGDKVTVSYVGTLPTGTEFDSTKKHGKDVTFTLGKDEVIPGLEAGVMGMKVGGERYLKVPPAKGIPQGTDIVPANSVIFFDVTLKKIG